MSILSEFEDRIARTVEGLFGGVFRSPVQPVEIAKALAREMDQERAVGVGKVYVPTAFEVALSEEDADNLMPMLASLGEELAVYLNDHAREAGYHLTMRPEVHFGVDDDMRLGKFWVRAVEPEGRPEQPQDVETRRTHSKWSRAMATVTVEDTDHDVALSGDRAVMGRMADSDIVITDANVSRHHAALERRADGWWLVDLQSTNGTKLNGAPVTESRLADGDVISLGATRLRFNEPRG